MRCRLVPAGQAVALAAMLFACLVSTGCPQPKQGTQAKGGGGAGSDPTQDGADGGSPTDATDKDATDKDATDKEATSTGDPPSQPSEPNANAKKGEDGGQSATPDAATGDDPPSDKPPEVPAGPPHPFAHRIAMPEFPEQLQWLNSKQLTLGELRGKFVLLDFWTYCCINCMHVLPELKKLEQAYPNQLVVIGVHSAKFENEKITDQIAQAILRYEIEHPVVNDLDHQYWDTIGIRSWPTILLIDPEGNAIWARAGEFQFEEVDRIMQVAVDYYREQKLLDETPLRFELLEYKSPRTPLRYPGKVLADAAGNRLFISDSNHNRILITTLDGNLQETIGTGHVGAANGDYASCSFNHPQGMALHGEVLYVADTENHLLRRIDLATKQVTTIAGIGEQGRIPFPGMDSLFEATPADETKKWVGPPLETALNSPWALWVHEDNLYIAMAGPHQIWKMPLNGSEIGPYAGNGREDIVNGALLPSRPFGEGSSFAQPSGLTSDGTWLYVADSEGSSVRAVPFDPELEVRTVVGTDHLPFGRLFHFGDLDGPKDMALLQHCLGVCYHEGQIYVADSYNHKIKVVNAETGETRTLAGTGQFGYADDPPQFHEPSGLSIANGLLYVADTNNHLIRTVELATGKVGTLQLTGVEPPAEPPAAKPSFADAARIDVPAAEVKLRDGQVTLRVTLELPAGWKINDAAPLEYWVEAASEQGPVDRSRLGHATVDPPSDSFSIVLPTSGEGEETMTVSLIYYYCETEGGLCKAGSAVWHVPLSIRSDQGLDEVLLPYSLLQSTPTDPPPPTP